MPSKAVVDEHYKRKLQAQLQTLQLTVSDLPDSELQIAPPPPETEELRERRLRREAVSDRHLRLHYPKNPYCRICQDVKAYARQARRRDPQTIDQALHFGDQLLTDHVVILNEEGHSEAGDKAALFIMDEATGEKDFVAVPTKGSDDAVPALKDYA